MALAQSQHSASVGQPRACIRSKALALACFSKFTLSVSPRLSWAVHNACHGVKGSVVGMVCFPHRPVGSRGQGCVPRQPCGKASAQPSAQRQGSGLARRRRSMRISQRNGGKHQPRRSPRSVPRLRVRHPPGRHEPPALPLLLPPLHRGRPHAQGSGHLSTTAARTREAFGLCLAGSAQGQSRNSKILSRNVPARGARARCCAEAVLHGFVFLTRF